MASTKEQKRLESTEIIHENFPVKTENKNRCNKALNIAVS